MGDGASRWLLRVLAGDDTLRQERLTRDLHDLLRRAEGVDVGFTGGDARPNRGRKGGLAGDVALWAAVAAGGRQASAVLITLVREWCQRDRRRRVELTYGDKSITVTGHSEEVQERLAGEFWKNAGSAEEASE
jgi:hypothetical protein